MKYRSEHEEAWENYCDRKSGRQRIKRFIEHIKYLLEEREFIKTKSCAACKHFYHFMGSAGTCGARKGCPAERMKDYSDTCDCGSFEKKKRG